MDKMEHGRGGHSGPPATSVSIKPNNYGFNLSRAGECNLNVDPDRVPEEGEVVVFTLGGAFYVRGSMLDVAQRFSAEDWPSFELVESGDKVIIRSTQVVAMRGGSGRHRGHIGFRP